MSAALNFFCNRISEQIARDREYASLHGHEFAERDSSNHTIGDFIRAVLAVENAGDARLFYDGYLEWGRLHYTSTDQPPEQIVSANIGWCFGEGMSPEKIAMWPREAKHPVFG
jgi:hypothetical protein